MSKFPRNIEPSDPHESIGRSAQGSVLNYRVEARSTDEEVTIIFFSLSLLAASVV